jgi:ribose-phosphate pyrophosphokinase
MLAFYLDYNGQTGQRLLAQRIADQMNARTDFSDTVELAEFEHRCFPDGETYIRIDSDVKGQNVLVVCQLHHPNQKTVDLMYLSEILKQLGARSVGLVAPYLAYMRQDKQFHDGECITSRHFSRWISEHFDWLVTIDPHLHRYNSLDEIYSIPSRVVHATGVIADYLKSSVEKPLVIGPDAESEQWANAVAADAGCDAIVLEKIRSGDRDVEVSLPQLSDYPDHQPVLVDDIISTGKTMIKAAQNIQQLSGRETLCLGVHAVFAPGAVEDMKQAPISDVVTCNCIEHETNGMDVSNLLAAAVLDLLKSVKS